MAGETVGGASGGVLAIGHRLRVNEESSCLGSGCTWARGLDCLVNKEPDGWEDWEQGGLGKGLCGLWAQSVRLFVSHISTPDFIGSPSILGPMVLGLAFLTVKVKARMRTTVHGLPEGPTHRPGKLNNTPQGQGVHVRGKEVWRRAHDHGSLFLLRPLHREPAAG